MNVPRLSHFNPSHTGRYSIYLPRRDGRLSWPCCWLYTEMFTCPQTVTHPGTNHLIATWPGVKTTTSRSQVQRPNRYATKPPAVKFSLSVCVQVVSVCLSDCASVCLYVCDCPGSFSMSLWLCVCLSLCMCPGSFCMCSSLRWSCCW